MVDETLLAAAANKMEKLAAVREKRAFVAGGDPAMDPAAAQGGAPAPPGSMPPGPATPDAGAPPAMPGPPAAGTTMPPGAMPPGAMPGEMPPGVDPAAAGGAPMPPSGDEIRSMIQQVVQEQMAGGVAAGEKPKTKSKLEEPLGRIEKMLSAYASAIGTDMPPVGGETDEDKLSAIEKIVAMLVDRAGVPVSATALVGGDDQQQPSAEPAAAPEPEPEPQQQKQASDRSRRLDGLARLFEARRNV